MSLKPFKRLYAAAAVWEVFELPPLVRRTPGTLSYSKLNYPAWRGTAARVVANNSRRLGCLKDTLSMLQTSLLLGSPLSKWCLQHPRLRLTSLSLHNCDPR